MNFNIVGILLLAAWLLCGLWSLEKLSGTADEKSGVGKFLLPWLNLLALITGPVIPLILFGKPILTYICDSIRSFAEKDRSGLAIIRSSSAVSCDRIALSGDTETTQNTDADMPLKRLMASFLASGSVDVAIDCAAERSTVSCRKNGKWTPPKALIDPDGAAVALLKEAAGCAGGSAGRPQNGGFQLKSGKKLYDVTVAVLPSVAGERITVALAEAIREPESAAELGISGEKLKELSRLLSSGAPLIIIGGAGGSGRSKTLHAILKEAVPAGRTIALLESRRGGKTVDGVIQMQADAAAGVTPASLLNAVLDQQPDVIAVDELSGKDVMAGVFKAVSFGIPVIAVVEAEDLPGIFGRLFTLGASPAELDKRLTLMIHQQLTGRLCRSCAAADQLPEYLQQYFAAAGLPAEGLRKSAGCRNCQGTGYRGECGIFDFYTPGASLKAALNAVPVQQTAVRRAVESEHEGVLFADALKLAAAGVIPVAAAEALGRGREEKEI